LQLQNAGKFPPNEMRCRVNATAPTDRVQLVFPAGIGFQVETYKWTLKVFNPSAYIAENLGYDIMRTLACIVPQTGLH